MPILEKFLYLQRLRYLESLTQLKFCIMLKFEDFDFTGKRVRYRGECQSKFNLSYLIGMIEPLSCYAIYPDGYPYQDYANYLMTHLKI